MRLKIEAFHFIFALLCMFLLFFVLLLWLLRELYSSVWQYAPVHDFYEAHKQDETEVQHNK